MNIHGYFITLGVVLSMLCHAHGHAQGTVGVALEYDSATAFTVSAGESITFDLVARNERLNVVETWDNIGRDVALTVRGSHAESDSSTRSWNHRSRAFTWLHLKAGDAVLTLDSLTRYDDETLLHYTIPKSAFSLGRAALVFTQSGADTGIVLSIAPAWNFLEQESPPISVTAETLDNYLVEITSQTAEPDEVYLLQRYEIVVTPRDRYLNELLEDSSVVEFVARFQNEYDQNQPGLDWIFDSTPRIDGQMQLFLASRIVRPDTSDARYTDPQWIGLHSISDSMIRGRSNPYAILDHAPSPFALLSPHDGQRFELRASTNREIFSWERPEPVDPYTNIRISRFDTSLIKSDDVWYKFRVVDRASLARAMEFESDHEGLLPQWTATHTRLKTLVEIISGLPHTNEHDFIWWAKATDGLYITQSDEMESGQIGHAMTIDKRRYYEVTVDVVSTDEAVAFSLSQNYPNPFNPSTVIPVSLSRTMQVRLRVCNLLGETVALLHDGMLPPGEYRFHFDAAELPSGIYTSRLESEDGLRTRRMLLLR